MQNTAERDDDIQPRVDEALRGHLRGAAGQKGIAPLEAGCHPSLMTAAGHLRIDSGLERFSVPGVAALEDPAGRGQVRFVRIIREAVEARDAPGQRSCGAACPMPPSSRINRRGGAQWSIVRIRLASLDRAEPDKKCNQFQRGQ